MRLAPPAYLLTTAITTILRARAVTASAGLNVTFNPLNTLRQFPLSFYSSQAANMTRLAPVISISHGGGPMPILGDPGHGAIIKSLKTRVPQILKLGTDEEPRAIVLVTAHWSTNVPTISNGAKHELLYDYYGFPPESYQLKYNAPGSPEVAELVEKALKEEGLQVKKDPKRGWDHGVFVPMMLINPSANIPILQMSILSSESPREHFAYGRALAKLRSQNIAIIGSGFASLHNLRQMFNGNIRRPEFKTLNVEWSKQVTEAAQTESLEERGRKFEQWRSFKGAYDMHPREDPDHFLPLIVCAGAGGEGKAKAYADEFMGLDMWSYYWE